MFLTGPAGRGSAESFGEILSFCEDRGGMTPFLCVLMSLCVKFLGLPSLRAHSFRKNSLHEIFPCMIPSNDSINPCSAVCHLGFLSLALSHMKICEPKLILKRSLESGPLCLFSGDL